MDIKMIDVNKIKPDPNNPRKGKVNQEDLRNMALTFKSHSIIQPLEIDENNRIIIGEQRWTAAKLVGIKEIPCIVKVGLTKEEILERQLIENYHRQNYEIGSCVEEIKLLLKREQRVQKNKEVALVQLANRLGIDSYWLNDLLKLDNASDDIKKAIDEYNRTNGEEGISPSTAIEIEKAPNEIKRDMFDRARAGINRQKIRKTIQDYKKGEKTVQEIRKEPIFGHIADPMNFRKDHVELILKNKKTQTSRFWHNARERDIVSVHLHEPNVCEIEIIKVESKKLGDFTEEDAKREGGYTLKEFKEVWKKIHETWDSDQIVKIFHFKVI